MKKIQFLFVAIVLAGVAFMSSCTTDSTPPTLTLKTGANYTSADVTIEQNGDITVGINASSETSTLSSFTIKAAVNGGANITVEDSALSAATFNADYTLTVPDLGTTVITFQVTDADGQTATTSFTVTTTEGFYTYTAVLMGGQLNPNLGSFYETATNTVMKLAAANAANNKVDFVYYYGEIYKGTVAAPADATVPAATNFANIANWHPRNATQLKAGVTVTDWSAVAGSDITTLATGFTDTKADHLAINDVVAFETASTSTNPSKKGLFKVVDMKGTEAGTDREITIEVKILK